MDRCETSGLTWTTPAPRSLYYGGSTSQGRATVVQLAGSRRSVKTLRVAWIADCTDGGSMSLGDALDDFPLSRGGRFGEPMYRVAHASGRIAGGFQSWTS